MDGDTTEDGKDAVNLPSRALEEPLEQQELMMDDSSKNADIAAAESGVVERPHVDGVDEDEDALRAVNVSPFTLITADGVGLGSPKSPGLSKDMAYFSVDILKGNTTLGIKVADAASRHGFIRVSAVVPSGAIDADGSIHVGDYLLKVNSVNLQGAPAKRLSEVITETSSGQLLCFEVARPLLLQGKDMHESVVLKWTFSSSTVEIAAYYFEPAIFPNFDILDLVLCAPIDSTLFDTELDMQDKGVVVPRGEASIEEKATVIQACGATVAIIVNDLGGRSLSDFCIPLTYSQELSLRIPVVVVGYQDGQVLIKAMRSSDSKFSTSIVLKNRSDVAVVAKDTSNDEVVSVLAKPDARGQKRLQEAKRRGKSPFARLFSRREAKKCSIESFGATSKVTESHFRQRHVGATEGPKLTEPNIVADSVETFLDCFNEERASTLSTKISEIGATSVICQSEHSPVEDAVQSIVHEKDSTQTNKKVVMPSLAGKIMLDSMVPTGMSELHSLMFDNQTWINKICKLRNITADHTGHWTEDKVGRRRTIKYNVPLNLSLSMGPKNADAFENQLETNESASNSKCRVLESTFVAPDIPYGKSIEAKIRYALVEASPGNTHLRITCEILFTKSLWGITKAMINRTAYSGLQGFWNNAAKILQELVESQHGRGSVDLPTISVLNATPIKNISGKATPRRSARRNTLSSLAFVGITATPKKQIGFPFSPLVGSHQVEDETNLDNIEVESLATVAERNHLTDWIRIPVAPIEFLSSEAIGGSVLVFSALLSDKFLILVVLYLLYRVWQLEQRVQQLVEWQVRSSAKS